ncbi:MAG: class I mannose-6-phosphate isomerase [Planctomycetes bacterium]|nr:class I mannose-6-phosphate isomerase [Planctomycetota bacterium]
MDVYPLIFIPIFKPKIWGGRKLETLLDKSLPAGEKIGESWEVADLEDDQSIVANGPVAGRGLGELVKDWGTSLIGRAELFAGRFPLLIKFLDACENLSVQVHPDEAMAKRLGGRVRVKNEAWYIIDAEPDGFIYRGLRPGADADSLRRAIEDQTVEALLNRIAVRKGHCYYLPSGTIHALGAGVTVAEVQTPSDITYRVYDYKRIEPSTGKPRELHIEHALECTSFTGNSTANENQQHVASVWTTVTSLVQCASFTIERVRMVEGVEQAFAYGEMVIWMILEGSGTINHEGPGDPVAFKTGDSIVIPAALRGGAVKTNTKCMWLEVTIPIRSSLADFERPDRASLAEPAGGEQRLIQLQPPKRSGGA